LKAVPLNCNHCGAPLSVPETARFVTCAHCHAQLAIHHEGASFFTEVLGEIAARTKNIEEQIEELRLEKDLERLDQKWEKEKKEILGSAQEPMDRQAIWFWTRIAVIGCVAMIFFVTRGRPNLLVLLLAAVVPVLFGGFVAMQADLYEQSEGFYQRIRRRIINRGGKAKRYGQTGESLEPSQPE
jgi:LSD1 subclass zinc finger protein